MENNNIERELDNPQEEKKIKTAVNDISADTAAIRTCVESISHQLPILSATREDVNDVIVLLNQYIEKLDDATDVIKKGVTVRTLPVHLSEEHVNLLDDVKSSYDIHNQRWERFCKAVANTGKLKVYLTAIISVLLTVGVMVLAFSESHYVWAHRALVAAIDMNHENPIGQYLTCMAEMPKDSKVFKEIIRAMEHQAEKTLFLESVLKDYIDVEFLVEKYEARKSDYLEYAVVCRHTGSAEVHVYNVFLNGEEVAMVTKRCPVSSKKKGDKTEYKWEEVSPIEQEIE